MKKVKLLFIGVISLVVFGFLLPQPIQALLVIIDTPIKKFFVILNGILYAYELQLFNATANFDIWFMIVYSIAIIAISSIICRKE